MAKRIKRRFRDISEIGRITGWDLAFRQLDAGAQLIPAQVIVGKHSTLISMRFNRSFHQLGKPPNGMLTFGVPVAGLRDWFGRDYSDLSILPFNHPAGIDGVSERDFEAYTISIAGDFLHVICETYQVPVPGYVVEPGSDSIIRNNRFTQHFRAALSRVFSDAHSPLDREHEDDLVVTLLSASLASSATIDKSTPVARARAVQAALKYIDDNPGEALTIRAICEHTGVALRTLNRAFRERFGIGPKSYLLRQRLSVVRSELLVSPPETLVADVANQWGFWHMGQFASDYKKLFGELPSETLGH